MIARRDDLVRAAGRCLDARTERLVTVVRDIRQAQAEALGRAGERLQGLLDRVAAMDRWLDAVQRASGGVGTDATAAIQAQTERRNRLRDEAARIRHHLVIQREALGLARHGSVDQCYPLPGRRRLPDGPARGERTS